MNVGRIRNYSKKNLYLCATYQTNCLDREINMLDTIKMTNKIEPHQVFNDDIPYEVRMKYIIESYRKDIKRLEQLTKYTKGLEEENVMLQKELDTVHEWNETYHEKMAIINQQQSEINRLKGLIVRTFPKRVLQKRLLKQKIRDLEVYSAYLKKMLHDNDIEYKEKMPNSNRNVEKIIADEINEFAIRGPKENYFVYDYPRPALTADCIVITKEAKPRVLLIQRGRDPYKGCWAFPGGFLNMDETVEQCAIRELEEETGLKVAAAEQIGTYSKIDRDPRGRTLTVAYLAIIDAPIDVKGQDDAAKAQWFSITELPRLAFDHADIIRDAFACYICKVGHK